MPKAMYAIWWDDKLGPMVGRSYPEDELLTSDEAVLIFMGHGVNQEAKIGYTKLQRGLIISYLRPPNCIAVLLDEDDNSVVVERNLVRLIPRIDLDSSTWDDEIKRAFEILKDLLQKTTGEELLASPKIRKLIDEIAEGRVESFLPWHVLKGEMRYPKGSEYLGDDDEEVGRILKDLEDAGVLVPRTYGRRIKCRQCGASEATIELQCPDCESPDLHNVYTVYCPLCSSQFHTIIEDDITEVICQNCKEPVKVADLETLDVEPLCKACGRASNDPKIALSCAVCGKHLEGPDLLGGTGLAYYPRRTSKE